MLKTEAEKGFTTDRHTVKESDRRQLHGDKKVKDG